MSLTGGYVIGATGDVATALSLCPAEFFAAMHLHPKELHFWLDKADNHLFWGDPPFRVPLEQYRAALIRMIEQSLSTPAFVVEKKEVLAHFRRTPVRLTQ